MRYYIEIASFFELSNHLTGLQPIIGEKAAKYLYAAFKELSDEMKSVAMPFIAPANDGSVVFEWSSQKAELIVVFRPNTQMDVEYLTVKKQMEQKRRKKANSIQ